jgi:hypothetical protein
VWRRLGYQWVNVEIVEKWIQFVQGNRKTSPKFEPNEIHFKLLRVLLEEFQNFKSAIAEWTDTSIKAMKVSFWGYF